MDDCSRHSKQVNGVSDMKLLAEAICDMDYVALDSLLYEMHNKLWADAAADRSAGRVQLAKALLAAASLIGAADMEIRKATKISKPFMKQ